VSIRSWELQSALCRPRRVVPQRLAASRQRRTSRPERTQSNRVRWLGEDYGAGGGAAVRQESRRPGEHFLQALLDRQRTKAPALLFEVHRLPLVVSTVPLHICEYALARFRSQSCWKGEDRPREPGLSGERMVAHRLKDRHSDGKLCPAYTIHRPSRPFLPVSHRNLANFFADPVGFDSPPRHWRERLSTASAPLASLPARPSDDRQTRARPVYHAAGLLTRSAGIPTASFPSNAPPRLPHVHLVG
jgi:hypothetical protein